MSLPGRHPPIAVHNPNVRFMVFLGDYPEEFWKLCLSMFSFQIADHRVLHCTRQEATHS